MVRVGKEEKITDKNSSYFLLAKNIESFSVTVTETNNYKNKAEKINKFVTDNSSQLDALFDKLKEKLSK